MTNSIKISLADAEQATLFAQTVAMLSEQLSLFNQGFILYLQGDLGVGKSHFSRGFIQQFLPEQKVKSPTYTIVESYNFSTKCIYHLDLYRLCDPEELEYLAIRDLFDSEFMALIEWPSKGIPVLPAADAEFIFAYDTDNSSVDTENGIDEVNQFGRVLEIKSCSKKGEQLVNALQKAISLKVY